MHMVHKRECLVCECLTCKNTWDFEQHDTHNLRILQGTKSSIYLPSVAHMFKWLPVFICDYYWRKVWRPYTIFGHLHQWITLRICEKNCPVYTLILHKGDMHRRSTNTVEINLEIKSYISCHTRVPGACSIEWGYVVSYVLSFASECQWNNALFNIVHYHVCFSYLLSTLPFLVSATLNICWRLLNVHCLCSRSWRDAQERVYICRITAFPTTELQY